jgi:hypothetical protein
MSFLAKLVLGEKEFVVLTADYEVSQTIGRNNLPNQEPHLGLIRVTVETDNRADLFSWAMAPSMTKSGSIVFFRRDAKSALKTLNFTDAFCVSYREMFDAEGSIPMKANIVISARGIECMGIGRYEAWPGFDTERQPAKPPANSAADSSISTFNPMG